MDVAGQDNDYAALLLEWNRRQNLTGARTAEAVQLHIADALLLLDAGWEGITRVIDIGSGGGLPAIPLAIHLPLVHFTLLEANARKAAFLQHAAGALRLGNIAVVVGRAERLGHDETLRERFSRATSRAAAPPPVLLELALPFIQVGGELLAEVAPLEPVGLAGVSRRLGGGPPRLERLSSTQFVLRVPKLSGTPREFPRREGLPNRRPLS